MHAIETIEKNGWKASLHTDEDAQSPDSWDNLATFEHSTDYTFGTSISEPERGWHVYIRALGIFGEGIAAVLPIRIADYGSGGLRIYDTDAENANGCLFTTHKRLTELCGEDAQFHTREWATDALAGELAVWSQYLEGDVYGVVVTRPDGREDDSCWGFYGFDYAKEEAAQMLDDSIAAFSRAWVLGLSASAA